jgi:glycosyltransferase involved in cell wall biosynthesis
VGIPDDAVVAAFVATLDRAHHFKRLDIALEAVAALGDERVHLLVAGGGELLEHFRRQASRAGIADRVHFLGRVPHSRLPGVLRAADLLLLTTEPPESFGIVLIEAMACGLPVIAVDRGGPASIVADPETGWLVPPDDRNALATAMATAIRDATDRRQRGKRARAEAVARYSWSQIGKSLTEVVSAAIAAPATGSGSVE